MPRYTEQFIAEAELNSIKGLCYYLDSNVAELSAEVILSDSNGERVGVVKLTDAGSYGFHFYAEDVDGS